jgi:hypothetical protein
MAETSLVALAERLGINTMVGLINDSDVDMDAYRAQMYYSKYALDKIKIGVENYVYLKYAKTQSMPKGYEQWTAIRTFPLTEHTIPLLEGIPPKSDKTKRTKITGTFHQYARYMEFSDKIDFGLLNPIMMEYADEYGDVAVRTMHRLARKELMNTTMKNYAKDKTSIGQLVVGDYVGLADFRLAALKMARLAVRPIGGMFVVITSEEHYWDLMKDPLIIEYLGSNNGLSHYQTGQLPELFGIKFEKTMLDDYAYGYELANPGEYYGYAYEGNDATKRLFDEFSTDVGTQVNCRIYAVLSDDTYWYGTVTAAKARTLYVSEEYKSESDFVTGSRSTEEGLGDYDSASSDNTTASESTNRLADGSWIPIRAIWDLTAAKCLYGTDMSAALDADQATKTAWGSLYYTFDLTGGTVEKMFTLWLQNEDDDYVSLGYVAASDAKLTAAHIAAAVTATTVAFPTLRQLPVHAAIMLGEDSLLRLEVEGEGNVQIFVKEKGSAGVLDPVNQRQSIGIKINTVGFKRLREEAVWVFYHVPTQAVATAGISLT